MTAVCASDIAAIGYDAASETLQIEFRATGLYRYFAVPVTVHQAFAESPRPSLFFLNQIKGRFAWAKIEPQWRCGKCEGGNFPEHSLHCTKRVAA
jgi:hypothetical protein